ncbi:Alpha-1-2-mannosidase [Penicillium verhagenii]|uniref:Alpha-1-2-mannosidase n=1 Tax=Penicillium verhagenii TaxID=1562060 RepID=UPI00254554BC|nr:Alpha-1-2-mannosidase [Penicillium verhagenii]KAJ5929938.1 Alpha-1-2-mannosidase [Penicillium verhagenii]
MSPAISHLRVKGFGIFAALLYASSVIASNDNTGNTFDVLDYVDPFIGTANGGHVFAGATLPFGMAKAVADTAGENQAGFAYDDLTVTGFSHMHDSGTGGSPSLGNFPIFAQTCDNINECNWQQSDRAVGWLENEKSPLARPGYFAISLENGVHAEMTTTNRSALYRFTFDNSSSSSLSPVISVDLMDLPQSRTNGTAVVDKSTGRLSGNGTFSPSFGIGSYDLHFCVDFKGAELRDTGVWVKNRANFSQEFVSMLADGTNTPATLSGGTFARFHAPQNNTLLARVGVSFISVNQACENAEKEQPDFDFDGTLAVAEDVWRRKLSGAVSVDSQGVSKELQTVFWSGLYRSYISPQDYTGENPLWESDEPYYDSYYCIWDSYRSIHPLLTIVDPVSQSLMMRSLVDIYRHEGYLPDCRMSLCKGFTQGGSNADVLMADSYLKKIPGIDWDTAYEAVVKDAEVEPKNWGVEGRGGLHSWKSLGYVPVDDYDPYGVGTHTRSVSRTVEYAYNDFCIAEMAKGMGHSADHDKYIARSGNWENLFKADQKSSINGVNTGFTGFLQPRYANGTWGYQDPIFCSPLLNFTSCYLNPEGHETYEGSSWLYSFYAPHDMGGLIQSLGGMETFTSRLQFLHESGLLYVGDEQAFLPVFQFHYSGRPALSSKFSHSYIPSQFNTTVEGIAGNDDSGAMGSFVALSMIGLWPVAGMDTYLINPPYFREVNITNGLTGKVATIRNINFDPTYESIYIQSVTWNGKPWTKNWVTHDFFTDGGLLELVLGPTESAWGTNTDDLPPSLSEYPKK